MSEALESAPVTLSSRFTTAIRVLYLSAVTALLGGAVWSILDGTYIELVTSWRVAIALLLVASTLFVWRALAFMHVVLEGESMSVRGLRRSWVVPVALIADVEDWEHKGWRVVTVTLRESLPGLGRRVRFIPSLASLPDGAAAELLEVAIRSPRSEQPGT